MIIIITRTDNIINRQHASFPPPLGIEMSAFSEPAHGTQPFEDGASGAHGGHPLQREVAARHSCYLCVRSNVLSTILILQQTRHNFQKTRHEKNPAQSCFRRKICKPIVNAHNNS